MSVTIRPYRRGGWEVDIRTKLPDGTRYRERSRAPVSSKTAAHRWGEDRERHLVQHGQPEQKKEVPTLTEFAPRFIDGYVRANRQKPSGVAGKQSVLKWHLLPMLGDKRLNAITNEHVQRLKLKLASKSPKTVNNVLSVLSILLKVAVEWGELDRMPCRIKALPTAKSAANFHDFDEYERLLRVGERRDNNTFLMVLLGGDAGLRLGENRRTRMARRRSRGETTHRSTIRLAGARDDAEERAVATSAVDAAVNGRVEGDATFAVSASAVFARWHADYARPRDQSDSCGATSRAYASRGRTRAQAHVLFASGDERSASESDPGACRTRRPDDDAALHALEPVGDGRRDPIARRSECRRHNIDSEWRQFGDGRRCFRKLFGCS